MTPSRQLMRALLPSAVAAVSVLLAASSASGRLDAPRFVSAAGWSGTDSPTVALDRRGDALLVWEACDLRAPACYHQVQARVLTPSGRLGPIVNVSELGPASAWPKVARDDDGDSVVVWQQHDTHTNWRIAARRVTRDGSLGPVLMLTPDGPAGNQPQVAMAPGGRALVAWTEYRAGASSGAWSTVAQYVDTDGSVGPRLVLGGGSAEAPAVAMDRRGAAVVAWTDYAQVVARRIGPGGRSSGPRVIAAGRSARGGLAMVRATADSDGDVAISFRSSAGRHPRVWLRHWRRSGSLGPLLAVSPPAHANGFHHALASDRDGNSVVVWTRALPDDRFAVYARSVSRAGLLGPSVRLGRGDRPDVALDANGDGIAVWHHPDDDVTAAVHGSVVADASRFGPDRRLADKSRAPQASAAQGRIVVTWQQNFHPYRIQAAANG